MRTLFASLIIGLSISVFAQTDTTKNNLERYKQLYEQGLISEQEYAALKKKELDISRPIESKNDTLSLKELRRKYRANYVIGSLGIGAAVGFTAAFFKSREKANEVTSNSRFYSGYIRQGRIFLVIGAASAGIGVATLIRGSKNRAKYLKRLSVSPNSVSVGIEF